MRLRLCAVFALMTLGLVGLGQTLRPHPPAVARAADPPTTLGPPEVLLDGTEHGTRLYPHFADFDGDGTADMLVGVDNRLLVYRNTGTNARPDYAKPVWFDELEPSARIPGG